MTAQEIVEALRSASLGEIAHIRSLLRVPEGDYQRYSVEGKDMPRDLSDVWNRKDEDSAGVKIRKKQE